jgi:hypothetical protein
MSSTAASRWPEAPKDRYCGSITLTQNLQANCYWSAPFSADGLQGFTLQSWKYSCSLAFDLIPEIRLRIQSNLFHALQVHSLQVNAVQKAEYVWMDGQEGQKGIRFNEMRSKTKVIQKDIPAGSLDFPEWSFDGSRYSLHGLCTQIIVMLVCHIHTQCWSPAWTELNSVTAVSSYWLIFLYFCNMRYDMLMLYALLVLMFDHQLKPSERFVILFDPLLPSMALLKSFWFKTDPLSYSQMPWRLVCAPHKLFESRSHHFYQRVLSRQALWKLI